MLDPSALAPRGLAVALLLALGACSSDDSGPSDQVLVGTWGSERAEFVAIQAGAEVRTACDAHGANTFTTRGELHGTGAVIGKFPSVVVSGSLSGARLLLVAPTVAEGPAITYQLEAGVTRPAGDVPECPL